MRHKQGGKQRLAACQHRRRRLHREAGLPAAASHRTHLDGLARQQLGRHPADACAAPIVPDTALQVVVREQGLPRQRRLQCGIEGRERSSIARTSGVVRRERQRQLAPTRMSGAATEDPANAMDGRDILVSARAVNGDRSQRLELHRPATELNRRWRQRRRRRPPRRTCKSQDCSTAAMPVPSCMPHLKMRAHPA